MENGEVRLSNEVRLSTYVAILQSNFLGTKFTPEEKETMARFVATCVRKDLANMRLDEEQEQIRSAFK